MQVGEQDDDDISPPEVLARLCWHLYVTIALLLHLVGERLRFREDARCGTIGDSGQLLEILYLVPVLPAARRPRLLLPPPG